MTQIRFVFWISPHVRTGRSDVAHKAVVDVAWQFFRRNRWAIRVAARHRKRSSDEKLKERHPAVQIHNVNFGFAQCFLLVHTTECHWNATEQHDADPNQKQLGLRFVFFSERWIQNDH